MDKEEAIRIIQERITKLTDANLDPLVWADVTATTLKKIFPKTGQEKANCIHKVEIESDMLNASSSYDKRVRQQGLAQATSYLQEYIGEINRFDVEVNEDDQKITGRTLWDTLAENKKLLLVISGVLVVTVVLLSTFGLLHLTYGKGGLSLTIGKGKYEITNSTGEKAEIDTEEIFQTDIVIHNETNKLNLSLWMQIPEELIDTVRFTPEIRDVTYNFEKLNAVKKYFVRTVYTSGLKPDVACLDCLPNEKVVFKQEQYTPDPGRENMKKYVIYYDISGVPIRQITRRTFRIITWNSFRNPEGDWAGTLVAYPTYMLSFQIIVPPTKKFRDLKFGTRPRGANSDAPIVNPSFSLNQDSTIVNFLFENPEIQKSYRIRWDW